MLFVDDQVVVGGWWLVVVGGWLVVVGGWLVVGGSWWLVLVAGVVGRRCYSDRTNTASDCRAKLLRMTVAVMVKVWWGWRWNYRNHRIEAAVMRSTPSVVASAQSQDSGNTILHSLTCEMK
jgi:hypothetical protein